MRSLLFAGATRPDFAAKLGSRGADAVVLDLEDAVPPADKARARPIARQIAEEVAAASPGLEVYVRVNAVDTEWFDGDVHEALSDQIAGVVVPKAESRAGVERVRAALSASGIARLRVVLGIETAAGVQNANSMLDGDLRAVYFGAEDYIADIGGVRTPEGHEVLYARSRVALAARYAGVPSVDQAFLDVRDDEGFLRDAHAGRAIGYAGKICIHPRQIELSHSVFTPAPDEIARARRLLNAWAEAAEEGIGAFEFEGGMVDGPALKMARATLAAARAG